MAKTHWSVQEIFVMCCGRKRLLFFVIIMHLFVYNIIMFNAISRDNTTPCGNCTETEQILDAEKYSTYSPQALDDVLYFRHSAKAEVSKNKANDIQFPDNYIDIDANIDGISNQKLQQKLRFQSQILGQNNEAIEAPIYNTSSCQNITSISSSKDNTLFIGNNISFYHEPFNVTNDSLSDVVAGWREVYSKNEIFDVYKLVSSDGFPVKKINFVLCQVSCGTHK